MELVLEVCKECFEVTNAVQIMPILMILVVGQSIVSCDLFYTAIDVKFKTRPERKINQISLNIAINNGKISLTPYQQAESAKAKHLTFYNFLRSTSLRTNKNTLLRSLSS